MTDSWYSKASRAASKMGVLPRGPYNRQLSDSLEFLSWGILPAQANTFAVMASLLMTAPSVFLFFMMNGSFVSYLFLLLPATLYLFLISYPITKAKQVRCGLEDALLPFFSNVIMNLRVNQNLEHALMISKDFSEGALRGRIDEMLHRIVNYGGSAGSELRDMTKIFSGREDISGVVKLIKSSVSENDDTKRQDILDNAADLLFFSALQRIDRMSRALETPVMLLFSFGVILPLVFLAIVPFLSVIGIVLDSTTIFLIYVCVLPTFLYVFSSEIISRRPETIGPQNSSMAWGKSHIVAIVLIAAAGAVAFFFIQESFGSFRYISYFIGPFLTLSVYSLFRGLPMMKKRKETSAMERGFVSDLYALGIDLQNGKSIEMTLKESRTEIFKKAASNAENLGCDLYSCFFDPGFGSLRDLDSHSIKNSIRGVLSVSSKGVDVCASLCVRMSKHLGSLFDAQYGIEKALGRVSASLRLVAMFVAPLVAGIIAAMSGLLTKDLGGLGLSAASTSQDPYMMGTIVGTYALVSAVVLSHLSTSLIGGRDRAISLFNMGATMLVASFVLFSSHYAASSLFGGLV